MTKWITMLGPAESVTIETRPEPITFARGIPTEVPEDLHRELLARNSGRTVDEAALYGETVWEDASLEKGED